MPDYPHPVVRRGHNRQVVFTQAEDCGGYLENLHELKMTFGVYVYCLMTHHVHQLLQPGEAVADLGRLMKALAAHPGEYRCASGTAHGSGCGAGRVQRLRVDMPPAFVDRQAATTQTAEFGPVSYDLCFGGMYFAIIDAGDVGLEITPDNAAVLARTGVALRNQIADEISVQHPEIEDFNALTHVMFTSEAGDGAILTCTTMRPGRVDRSACGTGSAALAALRVANGANKVGDTLATRSIIGGEFETRITDTARVGSYEAIRSTLSGRCWIYGISQVGIDPTDPFRAGFSLPDTWGGLIRS